MAFVASGGVFCGRSVPGRCGVRRGRDGWVVSEKARSRRVEVRCSEASSSSSGLESNVDFSMKPKIPESGANLPGAAFDELPDISNDVLLAIVKEETTDQFVNDLLWYLLGYVKEEDKSGGNIWNVDKVPTEWKEEYPTPPDFIGVSREYSSEVDRPIKKAIQKLTRSIPAVRPFPRTSSMQTIVSHQRHTSTEI